MLVPLLVEEVSDGVDFMFGSPVVEVVEICGGGMRDRISSAVQEGEIGKWAKDIAGSVAAQRPVSAM